MSDLKSQDLRRFERRLNERRERLRDSLHDELIATQRDDYINLAGQVHDTGDASVAELLLGVELSGRGRELEEMQDTEAALARLRRGAFGVCIDCRSDVTRERLEVYPTAKRCLICQQRCEQDKNGGKDGSPSL